MSPIYSEKESDMGRRQEENSIWEDKLGRDINQPKICEKSCSIYEVSRTELKPLTSTLYVFGNEQPFEIDGKKDLSCDIGTVIAQNIQSQKQ